MSQTNTPSRGAALIARIALQYPDRLPRDVLSETFARERTIAATARAFGVERRYVRVALEAFELRQPGPCSPMRHLEATRAGIKARPRRVGNETEAVAKVVAERIRDQASLDAWEAFVKAVANAVPDLSVFRVGESEMPSEQEKAAIGADRARIVRALEDEAEEHVDSEWRNCLLWVAGQIRSGDAATWSTVVPAPRSA